MRRAALAALGAVLLAAPARAAAPPVELSVDACVEAAADETRRLLRIELDAMSEGPGRDLSGVRVPVRVGCKGDQEVLRLEDPITQKVLERSLRLRRAPVSARPRLLALAIVELMVASWTELHARPADTAASAPAPDPVAASARRAAQAIAAGRMEPTAREPLRVWALGGVARAGGRLGPLAELGLRIDSAIVGPFRLLLDLRGGRAEARASQGRITFETIVISPGVVARRRMGPVELFVGPSAQLGYGRMTGRPDNPETIEAASFTAAWAAVSLGAGVAVPLGRLALGASVEAGRLVAPIGGRVAEVREVALEGTWLGGRLALGWAL